LEGGGGGGGWGGGGGGGIQGMSSWSGNLKGRDCSETYRVCFLSCSGSVAPLLQRKLVSAVTSSDMMKETSCRQWSVVICL